MRIAAQKFEILSREHVLQAMHLIAAGRKTKFADSTKYDVLFSGKRYAPKEVAGTALELATGQQYGPRDFSGGESSACFKALRGLGFTIVPKIEVANQASLADTLSAVAALQPLYSSANTPEMQRRGLLIRELAPQALMAKLENIEPVFSDSGYECCVEGSDGKGLKNESPWVRIYDPIESPRATVGWYLVIHFSRDGHAIYLTLGCGATYFKDGSLLPIDPEVLKKRIEWARSALSDKGVIESEYLTQIKLQGSALSDQFERATAYAKQYSPKSIRDEDVWADLSKLSKWLIALYDLERQGKTPLAENIDVTAARNQTELTSSPQKQKRRTGQGRGLTQAERVAVEKRAMEVTHQELQRRGFTDIQDKSGTESYDFEASQNGQRWFIEVKGTTNLEGSQIMLTANELRLHESHKGRTILCVVANINLKRDLEQCTGTDGELEFHCPWDLDRWEFTPLSFKAVRR